MQGFAEFIEKGGSMMYVNLGVSVIVLALLVDRLIFFVDRAIKLCSATTAPVAQVAKAGLQRMHKGEIAIAQSIEETLVDVTPLLKKRVQILWSLANEPQTDTPEERQA